MNEKFWINVILWAVSPPGWWLAGIVLLYANGIYNIITGTKP